MFGLTGADLDILYCGGVLLTTIVAGCMSGLTLSLFSLDETYLRALAEGPPGTDRRRATRVLAIVQSPHWLLVTLLLCNAAAIESMPMILDELLNPAAAIAISVALVLVFGEVIPQAVFVRHALPIGAFFALPLQGLMFLTSPVSWTLGKLLDTLVGHREAVFFRRRELREFLLVQQEMMLQRNSAALLEENNDVIASTSWDLVEQQCKITQQEISIMLGALSLSETTVQEVMRTNINDVVSLSAEAVVDKNCCEQLFTCGFSRIPIHAADNRAQILGYFITKTLITLIYKSEDRAPKVKDLARLEPRRCEPFALLSEVFQAFQDTDCHIAIVEDPVTHRALGIITAHDILEHIHKRSFADETDLRQQAPVQMIIKSWNQMQWRKQVHQSPLSQVHQRTRSSAAGYRPFSQAAPPDTRSSSHTPNRSFITRPVRGGATKGSDEQSMRLVDPAGPTSGYGAMR